MRGSDGMQSMTPVALPLTEPLRLDPVAKPAIDEDDRIDQTLHPTGFRILVQILPPEEYLKRWQNSNLVMPDEVRDREWQAQLWAYVIELGPEAYKDEKRFQKPWCQPGDCIIMRPYAGTRFMVRKQLYALINDDTVLAVVTDPGEIERA
jgi:co-chaperonin GroES (HSP10)